MPKQKLKELFL